MGVFQIDGNLETLEQFKCSVHHSRTNTHTMFINYNSTYIIGNGKINESLQDLDMSRSKM